jgi:hypothetical protein
MPRNTDSVQKANIANGRSREAAIAVIVPRILGALEYEGRLRHDRRMVTAYGGPFCLSGYPAPWAFNFRVSWMGLLVMTGDIRSDGRGDFLGRRVCARVVERCPAGKLSSFLRSKRSPAAGSLIELCEQLRRRARTVH